MKAISAEVTEARVLEVLDQYLADLRAGRAPDREALLLRHPDLAQSLAASFRALDFVHDAGRTLEAPEAPPNPSPEGRMLGDYRLLREIGRGGMAVVYEAEQVSLGRHVALKVLPFAAVLDPKQLQRFKNEAHAAANLHHGHIVPVHAVGCERGVHYYAMQYIEGQSLAVAIRELKGGGTGEGTRTPVSSHASHREPAYIRMATALGVQAAEALDHAHQFGIVHRDVKPGNLLVDLAGSLWVTDFGLAHSHKDVGLTITGELLGTIRYMSPEQALAKRVPIDHRTDVYSLGATLYELFTLEPAFPGEDPHLVIQDIASKEPVLPRRLNPALSRDLETVILKAMSKDPAARYATAQEMADDLGRCLDNRPIEAKRPGFLRRAAKWGRRHRTVVGAAIGALLLAVAGLTTGTALLLREKGNTREALERATAGFERAEANLALALKALDQIYVEEAEGHPRIREGLPPDLLQRGLGFYEEFARENAQNRDAVLLMGRAHHRAGLILRKLHQEDGAQEALSRAILAYREAARQWPEEPSPHLYLGHALDDQGDRDGAIWEYGEAIRLGPDLAEAYNGRGIAVKGKGDLVGAIRDYREAIRLKPDFADAHYNLGIALVLDGDPDGAIVEYCEAIRLRPDWASAHHNLGIVLVATGDLEDAIQAHREAVRLRPDHANSHNCLGNALLADGDSDGAIASFLEAILLDPDDPDPHYNLGVALAAKGDLEGAIASYREAFRLKPDDAQAHYAAGNALMLKGDVDEAIREYGEAIRIKPDFAEAHGNLGSVLLDQRDLKGAVRECREAVRLAPDLAFTHYNLANALAVSELDGAIREYGEAIRIRPDFAGAHGNLGAALMREGRFAEAVASLRTAFALDPGLTYPSKAELASAERLAGLEGRLDQVLSGAERPRDALERIAFAEILYARSRPAESARMYADVFAEDPALAEDLALSHRYNAACSAALAAACGGADAAEWRGRALAWLRADLAAREQEPSGLVPVLEHWKCDPDLAGVRDRPGDLPESEREAWRGLWAAVDEVLAAHQASR